MADYLIILDAPHAFGVEITQPGSFRSVRGFATKMEAQAWIDAELLLEQFSRPETDPVLDPDPVPA
jgi:hypothetical protein